MTLVHSLISLGKNRVQATLGKNRVQATLVHSLISLGENRVQAHKYLLSTVCADLVTRIVRFVAEDYMIPLDVQEVTLTSEV